MANVCRLCVHHRRAEIDKFILHGLSFKEFKRKFHLRSVSIYTWSRHRNHIAEVIEPSAAEPAPAMLEISVLDVEGIVGINKKVKSRPYVPSGPFRGRALLPSNPVNT